MDPKLLVRVYRYVASDKVRIGTGCPVSPGRILVARHVLAEDDQEIDLARIQLTFYRHYQPDGSRIRAVPSKVAWDGGGTTEWDTVVLECSFPQGFGVRSNVLSERSPRINEVWQSEGFPQAGQVGDILEPVSLKGTTFPCDENATRLQLLTDGATLSAKGWRGVSGAPVFIGRRILGLITETREAFGGGRLWAVPMFRLLDIPEFRKALGVPPRTPVDRARYAAKITGLFRSAPAVIEQVERSLAVVLNEKGVPLDIHRESGSSGDHGRADFLARTLVYGSLSSEDARDLLMHSFQECAEGEVNEQVLLEIIHWYLPVCRDIRKSEDVRQQYEEGKDLIQVPAAYPITADNMMAPGDGRPLILRRDNQGRMEGAYKIPDPPALGLEATRAEECRCAAKEHAMAIFAPDAPNRTPSGDFINKALARNCKRGKTLYFLFDSATNAKGLDRDTLESLASDIRTELPHIAALLLSEDQDDVDSDFDFISDLQDILKRG